MKQKPCKSPRRRCCRCCRCCCCCGLHIRSMSARCPTLSWPQPFSRRTSSGPSWRPAAAGASAHTTRHSGGALWFCCLPVLRSQSMGAVVEKVSSRQLVSPPGPRQACANMQELWAHTHAVQAGACCARQACCLSPLMAALTHTHTSCHPGVSRPHSKHVLSPAGTKALLQPTQATLRLSSTWWPCANNQGAALMLSATGTCCGALRWVGATVRVTAGGEERWLTKRC
jgi:hypothetical protein